MLRKPSNDAIPNARRAIKNFAGVQGVVLQKSPLVAEGSFNYYLTQHQTEIKLFKIKYMQKIHVGFLGAGGIAQAHVYSIQALKFYYKEIPDIVLESVASARKESRESFSEKYSFKFGGKGCIMKGRKNPPV